MTEDRAASAIGVSRPRPDAGPKVRGDLRYNADRIVPGLLHARPVLATRAHARIVSIDATRALAMPGVVAVLTADDLAIRSGSTDRLGRPLAQGEVVFAGQPIALVVARTAAAARDAVDLVRVRLEPLPVVVDPETAMRPGAPIVRGDVGGVAGDKAGELGAHASVGGGDHDVDIEAEVLSPNVVGRHRYREGDVGAALAGAAHVVGARFETSWVHQGYLEPQACTAWLDDDGILVVEAATQGAFASRNDVARAYGLATDAVRVVPTPLGGAFGGKWPLLETLVAGAALALRRPVRLALERREDLLATNPSQSFVLEARIGVDAEGRFVGLEARVVADAGAFADGSAESLAGILIGGPYRWPAFDVRAYGVRTNRPGSGAYRGPSAPPTCFALESLLDELAAAAGIDPLELRRRNAAGPGDTMLDGEAWPGTGILEVIDALAAVPAWRERGSLPEGEGVGVAVGYWPGNKDSAAALCRVSPDGTVTIVTGVVDMSGVAGGFQAIAAEVLGVSPESVRIVAADTGSAPKSPGSGGSTITYSAGRAIRAAAVEARDALIRAASRQLEIAEEDLEIVAGTIRPRGTPERGIPIAKVVRGNDRGGGAPIEGHAATEEPSLAPSVAGHVVHVRVDRETGVVEVLRHHVVQDVGRALNPALVTAQQHGAAVQSIGWALRERLVVDAAGQLQTATFLDYAIPRVDDVGRLETTIVEVPAPDGPFGAKGIGEAPVIAGAAAIANAVAAATGARMRRLPMTADRVWAALHYDGAP